VKKARTFATKATSELKENLGPGFEDLEPSDLNPKSFIKKQIANVMDQDDADSEIKVRAKIDPDLL
jgi:sec-independent protein translocase protein TatB